MAKSDVPFGDSFSPGRGIDLREVLSMVREHEDALPRFIQAVYERYWSQDQSGRERPPGGGKGREETGSGLSLATNTLYALSAYGLCEYDQEEERLRLSGVGAELLNTEDDAERNDRFARHILLECRGLDVLEAVRDMQAGGHAVTVPTIAQHLGERGLYVPPSGTHLNTMRQWLEPSGVVDARWQVDQARLDEVLGVEEEKIEAFSSLNPEQIAFARALARLNVDEISSEKVRDYAADLFGVEFPVKSLPKSILEPLEAAGLITTEKTTKGRGAKPHLVRPTDLLRNEVTDPILDRVTSSITPKYRRLVRTPLADILRDLNLPKTGTHKRGLALELLLLCVARALALRFHKWRSSSDEPSSGVDAVFGSEYRPYGRWFLRSRSCATFTRDEVAAVVGLAVSERCNVALVFGVGAVSPEAAAYQRDINEGVLAPQLVIVAGDHLRAGAPAILASVARQLQMAATTRALGVGGAA